MNRSIHSGCSIFQVIHRHLLANLTISSSLIDLKLKHGPTLYQFTRDIMFVHVITYLEMTRVSKLSSTVGACEAALVVVYQHVVVEAVLSRERRVADKAHKRLDS